VALLYGTAITYIDGIPYLAMHRKAQEYRSLIKRLDTLPEGVVLAEPYIENILSLYSKHKVYWSHIAFSESLSNEELKSRWLDTKVFFSEGKWMHPVRVLGVAERCEHYVPYLKLMSRAGFSYPEHELCDRVREKEAKWPVLISEAENNQRQIFTSNIWSPSYKLDYLVVDALNDTRPPKNFMEKYFTKVEVIDNRFEVYQYK
jgi:hypothetical protein